MWVYLFEAVWTIYGTTFIFSAEINECDQTTRLASVIEHFEHVEALRISAIVLLCLGYIIWIWIICSLLLAYALYKNYQIWMKMDRTTSKTTNAADYHSQSAVSLQ